MEKSYLLGLEFMLMQNSNCSELRRKGRPRDEPTKEENNTNASKPSQIFLKAEEKPQEDIYND